MTEKHKFVITIIIFLSTSQAKMMRNSALITKMVSNFHQNNELSEQNKEPESVLIRMQIVLCKNFPTIPCDLITQDQTLKKLIEKSIQQINHKKLSLNNTTSFPEYLTLFPTVNNDDLSKFIQMSDVIQRPKEKKHIKITSEGNRKVNSRAMKKKTHEGRKKIINNKSKRTSMYNRKKLRKFYPHLVKYANNGNKEKVKEDHGDNTAEKFSMSIEVPDMPLTLQRQHFSYKVEPENPPVWRIDYTKHGEPSMRVFDYQNLPDRFNTRINNSGPNGLVDGHERMKNNNKHPGVFNSNHFVKTNSDNSDGVD